MVAVPADMPDTTPNEFTVATNGLLLLHIPPGVALLNAADEPTQEPEGPVMGVSVVLPTVNGT